jgi:serine/threonine-protein kinase
MPPDPSTLLALLAHKLGVITDAQLADSRQAWRGDPSLAGRLLEALDRTPASRELRETFARTVMRAAAGLPTSAGPEGPVAAEPVPPPVAPGKYEITGEIGRGGLGAVVAARDRDIGREVALKVMRPGLPPEFEARFLREARLTGRLEHPNIVPVHEVGSMPGEDGAARVYYTMKRIQGRDLRQIIRGLADGDAELAARFPLRRLIDHFRDACLAVAYAHSRGVVHRDLKPSNVMIGEFGETLVLDWGLAKEVGERGRAGEGRREASPGGAPELTLDGEILGTPSYMSPEQAAGLDVDARSDLWSLGAILYELLTLEPPIEGESLEQILDNARTGTVRAPSQRFAGLRLLHREGIPPELEAICMKCLRADRAERIGSAGELAREIELYLDGVKERERARAEAARLCAEGEAHAKVFAGLSGELARLRADAVRAERELKRYAPVEARGALFELQDRIAAAEERRIQAYSLAHAAFSQALVCDPSMKEADDLKCALLVQEFLEAEAAGDRPRMLLNRNLLKAHDPSGRHERSLDAPGSLSISVVAYGCGCLRPRRGGWGVTFGARPSVGWRDGRPCGAGAADGFAGMVPAVTFVPEGGGFGHRASCVSKPVTRAVVEVMRYETQGRMLVPGPARRLGETPLAPTELPQGSWLGVVHPPAGSGLHGPVRFTFVIRRAQTWEQRVALYGGEEVPAGFHPVPGGPYQSGGDKLGSTPKAVRRTEDVLVARDPVTMTAYRAFLNDLSAHGKLEEARARQPRHMLSKALREESGSFRITGVPSVTHDLPATGVSWNDAIAYAEWLSNRDGRLYRLLHDDEHEKAARGADGRPFPWGHENFPGCCGNALAAAAEDRSRLMPVGSYPHDTSPYGIVDLSGNAECWCWNGAPAPYTDWIIIRGAPYNGAPDFSHAGCRRGDDPDSPHTGKGFRLCVPAVAQDD